jgi:hypothetical protein
VVEIVLDKSEVQVPEVVKHSSSPGKSPYHLNIVGPDIIEVNLRKGILVFSYNNGWFIPPKHENIFIFFFEKIFFGGQVEIGIGMMAFNNQHRMNLKSKLIFIIKKLWFPGNLWSGTCFIFQNSSVMLKVHQIYNLTRQ